MEPGVSLLWNESINVVQSSLSKLVLMYIQMAALQYYIPVVLIVYRLPVFDHFTRVAVLGRCWKRRASIANGIYVFNDWPKTNVTPHLS